MIKNTVYKTINQIRKKHGENVTLVVRFDNNIMEKINYKNVFKYMEEEYGLRTSTNDLATDIKMVNLYTLNKEEINQILLKVIRGENIDYNNNITFGVVSKIYEHNIIHYLPTKRSDIKFVGKNLLKNNTEVQYELEGVDFKLVNSPSTVKVEKPSIDDDFWN